MTNILQQLELQYNQVMDSKISSLEKYRLLHDIRRYILRSCELDEGMSLWCTINYSLNEIHATAMFEWGNEKEAYDKFFDRFIKKGGE